jgi:outer membrane receptor protein involved in Fe transport
MTDIVTRRRLLASTIIAGFAFASQAVSAQTSSPAAPITAPGQTDASAVAADTSNQEIVVTGSRISRPDLAAASPVAVLTRESLKLNNAVTVEQLLTVNPQFQPGTGSASNNPGDGAATIDLRGLGAQRTLVLIDGKRAPGYDTTGEVDVNSIPTALIKRIDILTGGASAVYGSDAVAGVVNFILDDRFTGIRADASSQISQKGDGAENDASLTAGFKLGDRGNIVMSGGYSKRQGVKFGARSRNAVATDSSDLVSSGGSGNTVPTAFDTGSGAYQVRPDGSLSTDVIPYNFSPVNYAQIPLERYNGMALGRYQFTDHIEGYVRGNYEHVKSVTTLAPTATAGFDFNIDPSNPFLTPDMQAAFFGPGATINDGSGVADDPTARAGTSVIGIRRRIIETGGRVELHTTQSYQVVGGLRGDLGSDFTFDVFAQYGHVKKHELLENDLSYNALKQALDVVQGPNGPQCFDTSNGCVPFNLFTTTPLSQASLAFVLRNAVQNTTTSQFVTGGNISGNLSFLKSPFADNPAAISAGVEYRREKAVTTVSDDYASGDLIYYGQGQNIGGKYNTKEAYVELKMPLVQDKPFLKSLGLEGGFRYSKYSTVGSVYTYKGGGDWSPVDGVRFRGIYQRAVRAPNINELYSPVVGGTGSLNTDPCAGASVPAAISSICLAQGGAGATYAVGGTVANPNGIPVPISGQVNIFTGGNPDLKAEKSDTFTVGVVVNPPQARAFTFSLDYYNIRIANAIDNISPAAVINQCFLVDLSANSAACSSIHRNKINGSLSGNLEYGVPSILENVAVIKTDGIDLVAGYHGGDTDRFNYAVNFSGTYTRNYKKKGDPTSPVYQCAGHFGGDCNLEPMPKWKHVMEVNLGYNKVSFVTRWRFLGKVKEDADTNILKSKIGAFSYFDETATVSLNKMFDFRVGVQNMLNKKPPFVGDTVGTDPNAGSTFPNTYDVIGRTFFAGVSANF